MTPRIDQVPLPALTALLPPVEAEFVTVTDTHLVDERAQHAREFASRLRQNDRVAVALRVAAGTGAGTVVHVGDLVQDYPESELHEGLLRRAVGQWRAAATRVVFAAGNTDVGDPHDPASPAAPVSAASMRRFAEITGAGWAAMDVGPVRVLVLTASLFNSGMELEAEQWHWVRAELTGAAAAGRRVVLAFHYPLILRSADDPDVGHYDVVNEPARSRVMELIRRFEVEAVFTGHSHFAFFNRIGGTRVYGVPSTSFTRPGFCELFSAAAPPDRGRDDAPKLGFVLCRVHSDRIAVHPVRTGVLAERADRRPARPVISAVPKDVPSSALGVVLRHPVANFAEVPDTFPSVVRQPVRNDYPVLGCLELGARFVSVSASDTLDPALAERLSVLRDEGVTVIARVVWAPGTVPQLPPPDDPVDEVELVMLGRATLEAADLAALAGIGRIRPLTLSTLMRLEKGSAELPRWRYGLTAAESFAADDALTSAGRSGDRLLLHAADTDQVRELIESTADHPWRAVVGIGLVTPVGVDPLAATVHLAESFLTACAALVRPRLFVDGLTELDRTLDLSAGLLDRAGNPQPPFHALRILNSLMHANGPVTIRPHHAGFDVRRSDMTGIVDLRGNATATELATAEVISLTEGVVLPGPPEDGERGPTLYLHTAADRQDLDRNTAQT